MEINKPSFYLGNAFNSMKKAQHHLIQKEYDQALSILNDCIRMIKTECVENTTVSTENNVILGFEVKEELNECPCCEGEIISGWDSYIDQYWFKCKNGCTKNKILKKMTRKS